MNQYEVMYVIDPALEDSARTELINRFSDLVTKNGGEVDRVDEWGKRRLAYAIQYKTEGYYVLMYIKAPAELPREIERNMQISDSILRYLQSPDFNPSLHVDVDVIRHLFEQGRLIPVGELHRPVRLAGEQERVAGGAVVEQAALAVNPGGDDLETDAGKAGKLRLSVRQRHRIPPPGPQLRRQIQQRFVEISHEPFPVQGHGIVVRGPVQLAQGHFHQLQRSHRHLTPASGRRPR